MSRQNRATLYRCFAEGQLPTAEHFAHLIDSGLNMVDEGFYKSDGEGLQIHSRPDALLSFYRARSAELPLWQAAFHGQNDQLVFRDPQAAPTAPPLVTLDNAARVGINQADPRCALDVKGVIGADGRMGARAFGGKVLIAADGDWHAVTGPLHGCRAIEVMAGAAGLRHEGRYALLHALAMNTHNPAWWSNLWFGKKRIRQQHAYYTRRADRLQLRWAGQNGRDSRYHLEIRSASDYRADVRPRKGKEKLAPQREVRIQVYLTELWHDPDMEGSVPREQDSA